MIRILPSTEPQLKPNLHPNPHVKSNQLPQPTGNFLESRKSREKKSKDKSEIFYDVHERNLPIYRHSGMYRKKN